MLTIYEIRRRRLTDLLQRVGRGSVAQLNDAIGRHRTHAGLGQILNRNRRSATGEPYVMGDKVARMLEAALDLQHGWMDNPRIAIETDNDTLVVAVQLLESMNQEQLEQAAKVLSALTMPSTMNAS